MTMKDYETEGVCKAIRGARSDMPIKAKHLFTMYGFRDRDVRLIVSAMRENGELVVGNSSGYFLARDWNEYEESVRPQMQNCYTYLLQYNRLKRHYTGTSAQQLDLALDIYENKNIGENMEKKTFIYQKESNGEIAEKNVLVLHEDSEKIEGIDLARLDPDQRRELDEAIIAINKLKTNNYRRYNKRSIKE